MLLSKKSSLPQDFRNCKNACPLKGEGWGFHDNGG